MCRRLRHTTTATAAAANSDVCRNRTGIPTTMPIGGLPYLFFVVNLARKSLLS